MPPSPLPATVTGDDRPWPTVAVVLPALNEEVNLPLVLEGLPPVDEVIVVDGGSTDDTVAVAREVRPDAVVIRQTRSGKGNALTCGFAACTADIVVTLNADGSTDPGELPRYVDALLAGAEVAHGSRYREGGANLDEGRWDRLGNGGLNRLVNLFFGTRFTDLGFGYNAYWRALLPVLDLPDPDARTPRRGARLWGEGPEIEPLINIRMATQGLRVVEVASVGYPRIHGIRERHPVPDGLRALRTAAGEYLRRRRLSREAARHPGVHAFREERRTAGRRDARRQESTSARLIGVALGPDAPLGRHSAERAGPAPARTVRADGARRSADRGAPAQWAPDRSVTEQWAAQRSVPERLTPERPAPERSAPERSVSKQWAPEGWTPEQWTPEQWTPEQWLERPIPGQRAGDLAFDGLRAGDAVGTGQQWAEQQWARDRWTEQKSWREAYADPGAATAGEFRQQPGGRPVEVPAKIIGPGGAGPGDAGVPRATRASRRPGRRRPDLTVITGEGSPGEWQQGPHPAPLRAVPGETYDRT